MSANDATITRTVLRIPSITGQPYIIYSGEIRVRDDGHTRYLAEEGYFLTDSTQHLGPDNPANDPPAPDLAANLDRLLGELEAHNKPERDDALRRVFKVLDDEDVPGIIGMDTVETYELALKLIAAVRG